MARYEFKFVVTDVELSDEHRQKLSQAVAEAGALALASATPPDAVTVRVSEYVLWRGIPPVTILRDLASYATGQSHAGGQRGEEGPGDAR